MRCYLLRRLGFAGSFLDNDKAVLICYPPACLLEVKSFLIHDELDAVAACPAYEAVECVVLDIQPERRMMIFVVGTETTLVGLPVVVKGEVQPLGHICDGYLLDSL